MSTQDVRAAMRVRLARIMAEAEGRDPADNELVERKAVSVPAPTKPTTVKRNPRKRTR